MPIDLKRIDNVKELVGCECSICKSLLWNPRSCNKCNMSFCKTCIDQFLQKPRSDARQLVCQCGSRYKEQQCSSQLLARLSRMRIRCQYQQFGCRRILRYNELEQHENEQCEYRRRPCPVSDQLSHINELELHQISCVENDVSGDICQDITTQHQSTENEASLITLETNLTSDLYVKMKELSKIIDKHAYKLTRMHSQYEKMRASLSTVADQLQASETKQKYDNDKVRKEQIRRVDILCDKVNQIRMDVASLEYTMRTLGPPPEDLHTRLDTIETDIWRINERIGTFKSLFPVLEYRMRTLDSHQKHLCLRMHIADIDKQKMNERIDILESRSLRNYENLASLQSVVSRYRFLIYFLFVAIVGYVLFATISGSVHTPTK